MNRILEEDINSFNLPEDLTVNLQDSILIVTGATGLIGSILVKCLYAMKIGIHFILPIRDINKATSLFSKELDCITLIQSNFEDFFNDDHLKADYIIHCASPTNGRYMVEHPCETFLLAIESTKLILEFSRKKKVKGIVFVSSIEYYGQILNDCSITEDMIGYLDRLSPRNSYAIGKQAAEYLSVCYAKEYNIPVKIARLTQTFGAGISKDDNRVFAQFARNVLNKEDICLQTEGRSAKPYCYTTDCISALLYILLKGEAGEAYNVSTPDTYVSIRELAEIFISNYNPNLKIKTQVTTNHYYAPETTVNLNPEKLMSLGWQPKFMLKDMVCRLMEFLKEENSEYVNV